MDNGTEKCVVYKRPYHIISEQLQNMRKQDELCDVTIQVGEQSFRAHKVILSAAINYFREMFLRDSREVDEKVIWVIPDVKPENMETFIDFAYSGEIKLTEKSVQSLLNDASHLGLTDVKTESFKFIESILNPTNAFLMYQLGKTLGYPTVMEKSCEMITSNFSEAVKTQEFLDISSEFLGDILKCKNVRSGSSEIAFDGIMKWMTHNIEERKQYLSTLLELVNLSDLSTDYSMGYFFKAEMIDISNEHKELVHIVMSQYHQNKGRNVVNRGIINNHPDVFLVLNEDDAQLYFETYDSEAGQWRLSIWNPEFAGPVGFSSVHNDVVYLSDIEDDVYTIDVQQRRLKKLLWMMELCEMNKTPRSYRLLVLDGFLYQFIFDFSKCSYAGLRYCLNSKQWGTTSSTNCNRLFSQFVVGQGYIYAIDDSYKVHRYCPRTDKWEIVFDGRGDVYKTFEAAELEGKIYVCGGEINDVVSNAVECFDPEAKRWQLLASMNQARVGHSVVAFNGKILAIGGYGGESIELSSIEEYDPISNSWSISSVKKMKGRVWGGVPSN